MIRLRLAFSASLLLLPFSVAAVAVYPAAVPAQHSATHQGKALELARLLHPEKLAVEAARKGMDEYLVPSMLEQPDMAEMEAEYPGIVKAMYVAARPLLLEAERKNVGKIQAGLTELYLEELSPEEIDDVYRFYSGPVGQKVVRGMFDPAATKSLIAGVVADPDTKISAEMVEDSQIKAISRIAAQTSAEDEKAAADFIKTPSGAKFASLIPKVNALVVEIVNAPPAEEEQAEVDAAMLAVAEKFEAAGGAE